MANSARIDDLKNKFDENPRRYFAPLANEYRKAGDPDQAIAICREFLPQQPGHMSGHIVYGQALYDAHQLDEAKAVFDTALTLDPENLIALRYLGDIARGLGDPASARTWYQRVLDADPRNDEIAGLLTSLVDAPQTAASDEPLGAGPTGTVRIPSVSVEELPSSTLPDLESAEPAPPAPVAEPVAAASPPESPAPQPVVASEPAMLTPMLEVAEPVAAVASAPPPEASAPAADDLLDLDDLDLAAGEPVASAGNTPRPSLETTGFDVERADDGLLMPAVGATNEFLSEEAAADIEPDDGADADLFPLEDPDLAVPGPTASTPPVLDPFATETMADLYLSQGHREDAVRVYRQLVAQRPDDVGLEAKLAAAESAVDPAPPAIPAPQEVPDLDVSAFTFEPGVPGGGVESVGGLVSSTLDTRDLVIERPDGLVTDEQLGGPAIEPPRQAAETVQAAPSEPVQRQAPAVPAATGPSIREFLTALGRYVRGESRVSSESPDPEPRKGAPVGETAGQEVDDLPANETVLDLGAGAVEAGRSAQPDVGELGLVESEPVAEMQRVENEAGSGASPSDSTGDESGEGAHASNGGSINLMFDSVTVSDEDQAAAEGLAQAYGASLETGDTPVTPMQGAPARRATEELSLDSVFREQG
ncbi:MAG: tetratricopeptide repeat protein, partial [Gemmatimonadaceae bacterium]